MIKKKFINKFIVLILTITFIAILLSQVELGKIVEMLFKLKISYLVLGLVLYAISYFLRALRFYILLNREVQLKALFSIVCIHNLAIILFPARSGELSYIYMLSKRHNKTLGDGAATLLTARIFDFIIILSLFLISTIIVKDLPIIMIRPIEIAGFLVFIGILVLLIFIYQLNRFVSYVRIIAVYLKIDKINLVGYIFSKMDEMIKSFNSLDRDKLLWSGLISLFIWIILYSVTYTAILAMRIDMAFDTFLLASSFYFMISIIPLQGVGGFGTFEGSWAISFIATGIGKEIAISSGFIAHMISIFYSLILFIIGYIMFRRSKISGKI
ncbi:MAG: lysylphosphatidylglycerol synthase transmembrane domain-containing protein [Candidatus Methanoperedens sp.]|nr:lysylphosphatidylglycerol synthase transmembrane domain-containing protein [Candidatus Methanoperedens sp.]